LKDNNYINQQKPTTTTEIREVNLEKKKRERLSNNTSHASLTEVSIDKRNWSDTQFVYFYLQQQPQQQNTNIILSWTNTRSLAYCAKSSLPKSLTCPRKSITHSAFCTNAGFCSLFV
jgi:hypothetical protein